MLDRFLPIEKTEVGCDEAGRGCLAGPVTCAAVILPPDFHHPLLNDSKQLSEKSRTLLRPIIEKEAIAYHVQFMNEDEIARLNILKASLTGMALAVKALNVPFDLALIDGNKNLLDSSIPNQAIVKGDGKYVAIAAASVLAKTYRDEFMENLHHEFPNYHWNINKGYPTPAHRKAILEFGSCKYHRSGFKLLSDEQLKLF